MPSQMSSGGEKRRHTRLRVNLPIQALVDGAAFEDMTVVDISRSGMQIRSQDFERLKAGFDSDENWAEFEIQITARLAWVQHLPDGDALTGWEFVLGEVDRDVPTSTTAEDQRRHPRLQLNLPARAQVARDSLLDVEVVDISPSGMQIRCRTFEALHLGGQEKIGTVVFEILISGRLAWAHARGDLEFVTGWEFDLTGDEDMIG